MKKRQTQHTYYTESFRLEAQRVSYVKQVGEALQYAHEQKLIHRDIKPENMLIGRRDEVLLGDFGIAAVVHSTSSMSTQMAMGTMPYMAPEQIQEYPRPASDQYALGVVAYEWLCGDLPFRGSLTEIMAKHVMVLPPSIYLCKSVTWPVHLSCSYVLSYD